MSETPEHEENDPLGPFDAFRARRAEEQAANEPFPEQYVPGLYETGQYVPGPYEAGNAGDAGEYTRPLPFTHDAVSGRGRGRLRSVAVLAGAAVLVAGVVGGVYAATRSSGSPAAATAPSVSASPSPSPPTGASKGTKNGKAVTARLTVTSVAADSFTATAADGRSITAQITAATKFGTAARPFTRSQLVNGAVVYARLRHEADGTIVATVIASVTANAPTSASASADAGA